MDSRNSKDKEINFSYLAGAMYVSKRYTYRERWKIVAVFIIFHNINTVKGKITIGDINCTAKRSLFSTKMTKHYVKEK